MALTTISGDCERPIHEEATLRVVESANPDLDDPEPSAVCDGDSLIISSNGVPLYGSTDFHPHRFGFADGVDCLYDADEVATGESLVIGWAADGYPIISEVVCSDDDCSEIVQFARRQRSRRAPTRFCVDGMSASPEWPRVDSQLATLG